MFEECGRKALTDQKEKQMSDIRSKDMDQHNRVKIKSEKRRV